MTDSQRPLGPEQGDAAAAETAAQPTVPQPTAAQPTVPQPTTAQPTVPQPPSAPPTIPQPTAPRAPIRWGGVVWGLLLTVFAVATLAVLASAERVADVTAWMRALTPGSAWALGAAVLGLIIVVSALLGGIRASQRRRIRA